MRKLFNDGHHVLLVYRHISWYSMKIYGTLAATSNSVIAGTRQINLLRIPNIVTMTSRG